MKIAKIRNELRHRKGALLLVSTISVLGGVYGGKVLTKLNIPQKVEKTAQSVNTTAKDSYNNSLSFRLYNQTDESIYQLAFTDNFTKASVSINALAFEDVTYVRIFDQFGNLIAGEYTTASDAGSEDTEVLYRFEDAPKAYTLSLEPGAMIEIHATKAKFYSSLSGNEVAMFTPSSTTERYVVTEYGLRKEAWDAETGEDAMYDLLKAYLTQQIEQYQVQTAPEVLGNTLLDVANKKRVLLAYYTLRPEDQTEYSEFIKLIEQGEVSETPAESGAPEEIEETEEADQMDEGQKFETIDRVEEPVLIAESSIETRPSAPVAVAETSSLGGGVNVDDETAQTDLADTEDSTTIDEDDGAVPEDLDSPNSNSSAGMTIISPEKQMNSASAETSQEKTSDAWKKLVPWIVFGTLLLIALGKFIFDHYVR